MSQELNPLYFNFKEIHIGALIHQKVIENAIDSPRICNFFKCTKEDIETMYRSENINTEMLLKWSKLLEYDFFRLYSHHLILFSPPKNAGLRTDKIKVKSAFPVFRKHLYTKEIIDYILELLDTREKTIKEIIGEYRIPKTTLYKWIQKYKN